MFDLFETLISEFPPGPVVRPPPAWAFAGDALGIDRPTFQRLKNALKDRRMTTRFSYRDLLLEICQQAGVPVDDEAIDRIDELRGRDKDACFAPIEPSILSMLGALRAAGFTVVVLSNCCVEEVRTFEDSPLACAVDHTVWSFDAELQKPDAEAYLHACRLAGCGPSAALFVGDGSFDELAGARRAGMAVAWAGWFVGRWPPELAARREAEVDAVDVQKLLAPSDLLAALGVAT